MFLLFHVFLSRLLYSTKGISATDILPVICLGSDVVLNKSKFSIIIKKYIYNKLTSRIFVYIYIYIYMNL